MAKLKLDLSTDIYLIEMFNNFNLKYSGINFQKLRNLYKRYWLREMVKDYRIIDSYVNKSINTFLERNSSDLIDIDIIFPSQRMTSYDIYQNNYVYV